MGRNDREFMLNDDSKGHGGYRAPAKTFFLCIYYLNAILMKDNDWNHYFIRMDDKKHKKKEKRKRNELKSSLKKISILQSICRLITSKTTTKVRVAVRKTNGMGRKWQKQH